MISGGKKEKISFLLLLSGFVTVTMALLAYGSNRDTLWNLLFFASGSIVSGALAAALFFRSDYLQRLRQDVASRGKELYTSEVRTRRIVETVLDGIITINATGVIQSFNPAAERIFQYDAGEVIGKNITHLMPASYRAAHPGYLQRHQETGGRRIIGSGRDVEGLRKDGTTIPINLAVAAMEADGEQMYIGSVRDISDRKQAVDALKRHKVVLDTVLDSIITMDARGNIQSVNPAAERTFGYSSEAVNGMRIAQLIPRFSVFTPLQETAGNLLEEDDRNERSPTELVGVRRDGSRFPVSVSISETEIDGEVVYIASARDISIRKKAEADMLEAKRLAEQANKAKTQFVANMSHELRTPLNAVLGLSQLLTVDETLTEDALGKARQIYEAGGHLLALIDDILDLTKIEAGHVGLSIEPVRVDELIAQCEAMAQSLSQKHDVSMEFARQPAFVRVDPVRFKQILLNLLSNAAKYNRLNGTVRVEVERLEGGTVAISVIDNGVGMNDEQLGKLFEPFNRLGAETGEIEGTGIGLVITKKLVEMMDGSISVESAPGVGSVFRILFPEVSAPDELEGAGTRVVDLDMVEAKPARILVVEDNPINQKILKLQLEHMGHHVGVANNGVEGLDKWRQGDFDLVMTDINMPKMGGMELVRRMRSIELGEGLKRMPVFAITANAMKTERQRCLKQGMDAYLSKPVKVDEMEAMILRFMAA